MYNFVKGQEMKTLNTLVKIIAVAVIAVFTGCEKNTGTPMSELGMKLCGEWKLETPTETSVYLAFFNNNTFEEYQRLDEGGYELRRGTWQLDQSQLSGKYNDGTEWSSTYTILIADKVLTMISGNEDAIEYQYVQKEIPQVIKENCEVVVKSGGLF